MSSQVEQLPLVVPETTTGKIGQGDEIDHTKNKIGAPAVEETKSVEEPTMFENALDNSEQTEQKTCEETENATQGDATKQELQKEKETPENENKDEKENVPQNIAVVVPQKRTSEDGSQPVSDLSPPKKAKLQSTPTEVDQAVDETELVA